LKKAAQKLQLIWSRDVLAPGARLEEVFLVLFLQKKNCFLPFPLAPLDVSPHLAHDGGAGPFAPAIP
jgi:hypothetical protein